MSLLDATLPEGKRWTRVGDCYTVTKKARTTDWSSHSSVLFIPMEAIPQDGAYAPTVSSRTADEIVSGTYFERGDILVAKITPSFENGKQALIQELSAPCGYATTEVIPLHPKDDRQDRRLLFFYLLHPDIRSYVAERMEGSTGRQRVPENVLLDLAIPHFELEEQTAIANALEVIKRASASELECEQHSRTLKRATMSTLFPRGLRNAAQKDTEIGPLPESWGISRVEEYARAISKGSSPKWQGFNYTDKGILFVRSQNVGDGQLEFLDRVFLPREWNLKETRSVLQTGDLLLNLVGASIGRCAVGGTEIENANCNQAVCFVRLDQTKVLSKFLCGFLLTQAGQTQIHDSKKDIARANISLQDVRMLQFPKPSLEEQHTREPSSGRRHPISNHDGLVAARTSPSEHEDRADP